VSTPVAIPRLAVSMTDGVLAEWHVADGAFVEAGEPLYLLETDKVETEVEAPVSGTLRVLGVAGERYDVGTVVGEIVQ
jgi:pyruvate/2-oxoglutarate dehydrogenase complex dihydrolipoamide acyltransferase (E2) component